MVKLRLLQLDRFRSYGSARIELPGPRTLVLGPNAGGKTTIAEAIQLLLSGRSDSTDASGGGGAKLVRDGASGYAIEALVSVAGEDGSEVDHRLGRSLVIGEGAGYYLDDRKVPASDYRKAVAEWVGDPRLVYAATSTGGLADMSPKDRGAAVEAALGLDCIPWDAFVESVPEFEADVEALRDLPIAESLTGIGGVGPGRSFSSALVATWFKALDGRRLELGRTLGATRPPRPDGMKPDLGGYARALAAATAAYEERRAIEESAIRKRKLAQAKVDSAEMALAELVDLQERLGKEDDEGEAVPPTAEDCQALAESVERYRADLAKLREVDDGLVEKLKEESLAANLDALGDVARSARTRATAARSKADALAGLRSCEEDHDHCEPIAELKRSLAEAEAAAEKAEAERTAASKAEREAIVAYEAEVAKLEEARAAIARRIEVVEQELLGETEVRDGQNAAREAYLARTKQLAEVAASVKAKEAEAQKHRETVAGLDLLVEEHERKAKAAGLLRQKEQAQERNDRALRKVGAWEAFEAFEAAGDRVALEDEHERVGRLAAAFGPKGVRRTYVDTTADRLRDSFRSAIERLSVGTVRVDFDPFEVEVEGRPFDTGSGSERWRIAAALQLALAEVGGVGLAVIDRGDILFGDVREALTDLLLAYRGQVVLLAAAEDPAPLDGYGVLWVEKVDGTSRARLTAIAEDVRAAREAAVRAGA